MVPREATLSVEVASERGDESVSAGSMSLSSTMPDLPATPPPPLPGFTTLEVSGASWHTPSPQPGTSVVVSLPSPTLQGIGLPGADNYAAGPPNGAVVTSFQSRTGSKHACAGAFPSPAGESSAPPTPIMINSLPRTSSQCAEVSEHLHRCHQSLLGSSLPPGTARFTTLPTPFMSRVGAGMQSSGARSLREDSAVLSRASSFTPPAMRFAQRVRRRMLTLSQMQLQLSARDLFHTDHIGSRSQAALQVTAAASGITSPAVSPTLAAQGSWRAKNGPESRRSSSGSRSSNSRYQEYSQHSCGAHAASEMPQEALLNPHWLLSVNEDGFLRYEPLPSAAQPPPYRQSPPVITTADFAFLCLPYEPLARGIGPEVGHDSNISTSGPFGVSAGGVGVAVSGDGAAEEVATVLDFFFGLFSGARPQHSHAHQQRRPPHRGTTEAKLSLLTVNNDGDGATVSAAHVHSGSSPVQDGEELLPRPMVCGDGDDGQRTRRDKRHAESCSNSYPQVAARPIISTAGGRGGHGAEVASREVNVPQTSSPRMRVSRAHISTAADFPLFTSKRPQPAGCLDSDISLLPPQSHVVPGLPVSLTEDWLLPLRQVLVDRTIFLLVKPGSEETPASSLRHADATGSAKYSDSAMDERVVQRFLQFAKMHYGVTVLPWRVITFSCRDATRARNVMLAVYAQQLRRKQQQQQHGQSAKWQPTSETLSHAPPASDAGEDDVAGKVTTADGVDVLVASTASPAPRSGCSVSPLESSCVTTGLPVITTPDGAQTPPGASLMATSPLTLTSLVGGSEWRRRRHDGASRPHYNEDGQQGFSDPLYTLLTQELSVQSLSTVLEEYRPLLECHVATQMSAQSGASAVAAVTSPAAGICSQASCAGGTGPPTSTIDEGEQVLVDAARRLPGVAGSVPAIEGPATGDASDDGVAATAAAACKHAQEVVWHSSGAAGVSRALRYFQHAATVHRVGRAAFPVMMWSWQLYSLLPAIIKDAQWRCNRLRHNSRHCQHRLQGVQRSITLHLAASPAKNVAALEVRLQAGFKEMTQRFLRDLRRLFISSASAATTAACSPISKVSSPSGPATGTPGHGQRQQQVLPFAPLDALLVYDSPGLREAYRRLARAVLRFHAFYLAGQLAFDARMPSQPSRTGQDAAHERKLSQSPCPISVYEQRYAALREAVCLSRLQLKTPLWLLNGLNATPPDESCTRPGTSSPATLPPPPPTRAVTPATKTSTTPAVRPTPCGSAARTPATTTSEAEEIPMPKVELRPNSSRRCSSRITSAAGSAASLVEQFSLLRPVRRRKPAAAPHRASVEGGSDGRPLQRSFLSPSFLASAAREVVGAAACPMAARAEVTATKNGTDSGRGVPGQERGTRGMSSEQAGDEGADGDGTPRLGLEELQQRHFAMEHQLIAHVSQINTEIINFLLATCVAAVPRLQQDCVGAELARVKDTQAEIVSSFTTAVRGRKDAAIAMSHLYARLEEWCTDMSRLVSVVRSRPYLEKFITQLRAVLCEDEVRALAAFRCGSGGGQDSAAAAWQTPQVDDTQPSPSSAATKAHRGIHVTRVRLPLTSASANGGLQDSTLKESADQHPATPPTPGGTPCACASKSLAAEVGYRSARMLRYYIRLACKRRGSSGSDKLSDTSTAANAQRSGVFGEMLASPSSSRSLRSIQGANSTLASPHRSSRVNGGGGGGALGLSVSLSSMSAAWSREEACFRLEGGARAQRLYAAGDAKTTAFAFFASPTQPTISAVSSEVLAMLEVVKREPLRHPSLTSAAQAVVSAESRGAGRDGDASSATPAAAAAAHRSVDAGGSAWQQQLAQWRSTMTDAERPADDASAAPLLWIILDTWDETLLRMPYGLLLQLDTPSYADSLNRMSDELLNTQETWKAKCDDVLARTRRQLQALEGNLHEICDDRGEARAEYVRELRAVFDAAFALIAPRDDTATGACPFCESPCSTRGGLGV
ncbi:conserved hypothetical protein [Leishmania mexicana MHOM/GT/2001/U1103]|uniref:Uncharacterized protein n=1 Tax=Leishmania mexicana (strain MHOM/GT/2001/U1103) TaxID=929439 RepID=E9ALB2_LEIMU|nr:conserved hypothetical protein [Leishmania mexicana MHOM/GT/2001/U1103]CBZ23715.1 conserved hypothetical protein [Leishmania mexicana MHOM/GT/2001/U1103]